MIVRSFLAAALLLGGLSASAAVRPEAARLLPPDAVTIGGFDVQALRDASLFQKLTDHFPGASNERLDALFRAAGFDPKKDIHRVLIAGARGQDKPSLVVVEGDFDLQGRGAALLSALIPIGEHSGIALYRPAEEGHGDDGALAFLNSDLAVGGAAPQVRAAIDRWRQPGETSAAAATALAQQDAHIWATTLEPERMIGPFISAIPGGGGPLRAIAESMRSMALRATALAGSVHAEIALLCAGDDDARSLADALQAMAAFGALTVQRDQPNVAAMISSIQIRRNDSETTLSLDLTEDQLLSLRR